MLRRLMRKLRVRKLSTKALAVEMLPSTRNRRNTMLCA